MTIIKCLTLAGIIAVEAACSRSQSAYPPLTAHNLVGVRTAEKEQEDQRVRNQRFARLFEYLQSAETAQGQRFREERSNDYHIGILGKEIAPGKRFFYDIYLDKPSPSARELPSDQFGVSGRGLTIWLLPSPFEKLHESVQNELTILAGNGSKLNHFTTGSRPGSHYCNEIGQRTRQLLQQAGMDVPSSDNPGACFLFHQKVYERVLDELLELYDIKNKKLKKIRSE